MKDRMIIIREKKNLIVTFTYNRLRVNTNQSHKQHTIIEIVLN